MLLRSSSTPVLGSLLSSFLESPNNNINHHESNVTIKHPPTTIHQNHKLSLHQTGPLTLSSFSRSSSLNSPSVADLDPTKGFRRAQSEGNLEGLAYSSCSSGEDQHFEMNPPNKFLGRPKCVMLQTIPSVKGGLGEEEEKESDIDDDEEREEREENQELLWRNERGEESFMVMEAQILSLESKMRNMNILTEEVNIKDDNWNLGFGDGERLGQGMFLARGLGIGDGVGGVGGGGGGGGGEFSSAGSGGDGGDNGGVEEYYKKMVEEHPGDPLFLRNYAHFLYQFKGDLQGADAYYSRAILADPKDGEILSQYAKIVWELHHDQDRALSYFERAVQASPQDSNVQAAYASFLWDTEEDEESTGPKDLQVMPTNCLGAVASASA